MSSAAALREATRQVNSVGMVTRVARLFKMKREVEVSAHHVIPRAIIAAKILIGKPPPYFLHELVRIGLHSQLT